MPKQRKTVMTFGSFDILHKGHLNFFKQAKKKGDFLIVVLARDKNIKKIKKNYPHNFEKERKKKVSQIDIVDKVILGDLKDRYVAIKKYKPDVICLGYDQRVDLKDLKNRLSEFGLETRVCRLKAFYPEVYKSSKLRGK
jgi:FAD synthetase